VIVDEMDLVSQLKDVPPLRPEAYERARTTLGAAMAQSGAVRVPDMVAASAATPVRRERFSWTRNLRVGVLGKVGIGAIGAVAAAVAVVSVASSGPHSAAPAKSAAGSAAQSPAVASKLVSLADDINASGGSVSGDASLVISTQTTPSGKPYVNYSLYTDSGKLYGSDTKRNLSAAVAHHQNLPDPVGVLDVAAARYAATGDLVKAREQMVNATPNDLGLGLSPAAAQDAWDKGQAQARQIMREKGIKNPPVLPRPTGKALQDAINNDLLFNSVNALSYGAANPEVRAGVLRLISTIPDVTVADSTTGGQPTLTLTTGPALNNGDGQEVITINADTGMPISNVWKLFPGQKASSKTIPPSVETFQSSRVTVADVDGGKF
jgi:hypothetical protein